MIEQGNQGELVNMTKRMYYDKDDWIAAITVNDLRFHKSLFLEPPETNVYVHSLDEDVEGEYIKEMVKAIDMLLGYYGGLDES